MSRSSSSKRHHHDGAPRPETAVLFGVVTDDALAEDDPLAELSGLAEAADVGVAGRLVQRLAKPRPSTFLGSGKVEELKALVRSAHADLAIADMDLSPAQARNLTKAVGRRVIDRSELIMDIFAGRARTAQAKLQVELAQLKYALPRLRGQWSHLDRYTGGGVGTRGPGEKQLETDRRLVNKRIADLERRLEVFERRKKLTIAGRRDAQKVALAGYTNTGKSTLFNRVTAGEVYAANRLFATLDTRTRKWQIDPNFHVLLSDTVGFVRDLPHHLVASFHATLEEVIEADLVLHVVDATDQHAAQRITTVDTVMHAIGAGEVPRITVFNKVDAVRDPMELQAVLNAHPGSVQCSARTGEGLDELGARVKDFFSGYMHEFDLAVPVVDGRAHAQVRRLATVLDTTHDEDDIVFHLRVEQRRLGKLRAWATDAGLSLVEPSLSDNGR